ncbi:Odorant binding protein 5, partial [Operophtera brumata]
MFSTLPVLLLLLATARCGKDRPVFSEEIQEIIDTIHNECVEKTGTAEEDIQNCEKGIFKEDENLKCYMYCILEEASLVEGDVVDYDMMISLMPDELQDRTRTMLYACKHLNKPENTRCQRAFDVHKCTYEKDPDVFSDEVQEIIDTIHNECVEKTGAAEEDIQNCEKGIFKEDENLKCYMLCVLEESGLVEDGQVDYDMLISLMPDALQDRIRTQLYACKHLNSPDKTMCQGTFDAHKCNYEKDPD